MAWHHLHLDTKAFFGIVKSRLAKELYVMLILSCFYSVCHITCIIRYLLWKVFSTSKCKQFVATLRRSYRSSRQEWEIEWQRMESAFCTNPFGSPFIFIFHDFIVINFSVSNFLFINCRDIIFDTHSVVRVHFVFVSSVFDLSPRYSCPSRFRKFACANMYAMCINK